MQPSLRVLVFSQEREGECPLILAVLHESMDLIARLTERLIDEGLEG
jgi:hypothetical protein